MWPPILAISAGAALGALLRWRLGLAFNSVVAELPLGTLAANMIGGYVIGVAIAFFSQTSALSAEWRLFVITGFCGGLTTFSTFSAEVVQLLQSSRYGWAVAVVGVHMMGSFAMTIAGLASWRFLSGAS